MNQPLVYLASSYTHPDAAVMQQRFEAVCKVAGRLMREGVHLYSPIAHTHPIAVHAELPRGWTFWQQYDENIISRCDELWILMLDGWKESKGIAGELEIAVSRNMPVRYIEP